jgi:hypothetical protein
MTPSRDASNHRERPSADRLAPPRRLVDSFGRLQAIV